MSYADRFIVLQSLYSLLSGRVQKLRLSMQVQFWEHSLSQTHGDVHSSLACLCLHFFTQLSLHLQEKSSRWSWILWVVLSIHAADLDPTAAGCWRQCWCSNHCLTTDMSALVYWSSDVLHQGCTCRWNQLDDAFLCKQFAMCPVDISCGACSVVKQYDEPLNGVHGILINMIWCSG